MGIDAQMFVRTTRTVTPEQVLRESVRLVTAFGTEVLFVTRPEKGTKDRREREGRHALAIVTEYTQDGPTIRPLHDETFVEVSLWGRYYGVGYERGNLIDIISVARWLRVAFAPCEVWYGGDSSGVLAQVLDDEYERELWEHFCGEQGRAYFTEMRSFHREDGAVRCDFCDVNIPSNGAGPGYSVHTCNGCDGVFHRITSTGAIVDVTAQEREAIELDREQARHALLDATCAVELDMASVVRAQRDHGNVSVTVRSAWRQMNAMERAQLYERAGEALITHASRNERAMRDGHK